MYKIKGKFFYEILEDYKEMDNKTEIFNAFCNLIWESTNTRKVFESHIKFSIGHCKDIAYAEMFKKYTNISYLSYGRKCNRTDFVSLLRQKINNIYSSKCDKDIYLAKDYMELIKSPKNIYFEYINSDCMESSLSVSDMEKIIIKNLKLANKTKHINIGSKILITWEAYIELINHYMKKCFDNYIPIGQSESKDEFVLELDLWIEDNYCVKYFSKSIDGYFSNYEKAYFGVKRSSQYKKCVKCSGYIEIETKSDLCNHCRRYKKVGYKYITCIDCHVQVQIDGYVKKQLRCKNCSIKFRKKYDAYRKRKSRFVSKI